MTSRNAAAAMTHACWVGNEAGKATLLGESRQPLAQVVCGKNQYNRCWTPVVLGKSVGCARDIIYPKTPDWREAKKAVVRHLQSLGVLAGIAEVEDSSI
jgi:hypothetical protein